MRSNILILIMLVFLSACKEDKAEGELAHREVQLYTIEQFMDNEAVGGGSFSMDNSTLLVSSKRIIGCYLVLMAMEMR
jgi:hypothetical protein